MTLTQSPILNLRQRIRKINSMSDIDMNATSEVTLPEAKSRDIGGKNDEEHGSTGQDLIYEENMEANQDQGTGTNEHAKSKPACLF